MFRQNSFFGRKHFEITLFDFEIGNLKVSKVPYRLLILPRIITLISHGPFKCFDGTLHVFHKGEKFQLTHFFSGNFTKIEL